MSFYPSTRSPEKVVLDRLEALLRNGDALIHDPLPSAWPEGSGAPDDHYCAPEGAKLYRYDVPDENESDTAIALAVDGNNIQRHLDDDRYWLIPVEVMVSNTRDVEAQGGASALANDLLQLFTVDTAVQTAAERLSSASLHVWYIQEMDIQPSVNTNGRAGHVVSFTLFCAGIDH